MMLPNDRAGNLTAESLRQMLRYEPETGKFFWLRANNQCKIGDEAGAKHLGYVRVTCFGRRYLAHRLAWLWMTGDWPIERIDHMNMNREDNKWSNLRLATDTQNRANSNKQPRNKLGVKGVEYHVSGKFRARIGIGGKIFHLGVFDKVELAKKAYDAAAQHYFGEFSRK